MSYDGDREKLKLLMDDVALVLDAANDPSKGVSREIKLDIAKHGLRLVKGYKPVKENPEPVLAARILHWWPMVTTLIGDAEEFMEKYQYTLRL